MKLHFDRKSSKKYLLAPYVTCGISTNGLEFGFGSIQSLIVETRQKELVIQSCLYFKTPHTFKDFDEFLCLRHKAKPEEIENLLILFQRKNILIEENVYRPEERFSRNALFYNLLGYQPQLVQGSLEKKHVAILGCGGIGNVITTLLATAEVGKLTLIDDDRIEISNLTRQVMFCENEIGKKKTSILSRELKKRVSSIKIDIIEARIDSYKKFDLLPKNCDLIVISGDSSKICKHANLYAFQNKVPFINVGYIQDIAAWGPFIIPGDTACYDCFEKEIISTINDDESTRHLLKKINSGYQAPSIGPINMLAASLASLDITKYLAGMEGIHSRNQRIGLWTHSLKIQNQSYSKKQSCTICN